MKYFGQPDFYRHKKEYTLTGLDGVITWYVDFSDKKAEILSLFFETEIDDVKDEANLICEWAKGKHLGSLPNFDDVKFKEVFSPVFLSYRLFMLELLGRSIPYNEQKGFDVDDLTCRCFGVYKQELINLLTQAGPDKYTIADLGTGTRAGIGCGSCHHDLDNLLELFGHKEKSTFNKSWKAMDDKELAAECTAIIKAWAKAKVLGLRPGGVLIKADEANHVEIKEAIDKKLGEGLTISFR